MAHVYRAHECKISVVFGLLISSVEEVLEVPRFRLENSKNRDHPFSEPMNRGGNDRGERRERGGEKFYRQRGRKSTRPTAFRIKNQLHELPTVQHPVMVRVGRRLIVLHEANCSSASLHRRDGLAEQAAAAGAWQSTIGIIILTTSS